MASHLDLEEQEQLDQIKHFWAQWGTLISSVLVVVCGTMIAYNGYQYWQSKQAGKAAALFAVFEEADVAGNMSRANQSFADLKVNYPSTVWAAQASLIIARKHMSDKNVQAAEDALSWAALNAADDGVKAVAGLRLASLYMDKGDFDKAIELLNKTVPADFQGLYSDRKGDVLLLQKKDEEAVSAYKSAYQALTVDVDYRKLIEVKLNALGVDPLSGQKKDIVASEVKS